MTPEQRTELEVMVHFAAAIFRRPDGTVDPEQIADWIAERLPPEVVRAAALERITADFGDLNPDEFRAAMAMFATDDELGIATGHGGDHE